MNAEHLLKHYARISEAPDAITRLRRFVLDLAVRGKLVEQDAADKPASGLLKRIMAEKAKLGIRRLPDVDDVTDLPFDLPRGWALSSIGEVCSKTGSGSTPRGKKRFTPTTASHFYAPKISMMTVCALMTLP